MPAEVYAQIELTRSGDDGAQSSASGSDSESLEDDRLSRSGASSDQDEDDEEAWKRSFAIDDSKILDDSKGATGHFEVDLDVCASSVARGILSIVKNHTKNITIDLVWILEATGEAELPENVLGAFRLHSLDPDRCMLLQSKMLLHAVARLLSTSCAWPRTRAGFV